MIARKASLLLAALLVGAAPGVVAPTVACAGEADTAVLVVDTGEDAYRYCVALGGDSISGLELIQRAGEQHGLQYRFGEGGRAVCMLANVGAEGEDCFGRYPDYWGYWRGDSSGGWNWSSVGAGSTEVGPGDVEGWSWGSGQDGSTHPRPPETRYEDVCTPEEPLTKPDTAPAPPKKDENGEPSATDDSATSDTGRRANPQRRSVPGASVEEPPQEKPDAMRRSSPRTATEPMSPETRTEAASATESDRTEGPTPTAVAALALAGLLGAGAVAARRRRT